MANVVLTYDNFLSNPPHSVEVREDFTNIVDYVNARDAGTAVWSFVKTDRLIITARASDPGTPIAGEIWFNSTDRQFYGYDGGATVILG